MRFFVIHLDSKWYILDRSTYANGAYSGRYGPYRNRAEAEEAAADLNCAGVVIA